MENGIDVGIAMLIILLYSIKRFNTWPNNKYDIRAGKPSDYINLKRFIVFYIVYSLLLFILSLVLFGAPELLELKPIQLSISGFGITESKSTLPIYAIVAIVILNLPILSKLEEEWRDRLHEWARIPREVDDLKKGVLNYEQFVPNDHYINLAKYNIKKDAKNLTPKLSEDGIEWKKYLDKYDEEKRNKTNRWQYLNSLLLYVMAKDLCKADIINTKEDYKTKLYDLWNKLLSSKDDSDVVIEKELNELNEYYIECICKSIVKKYNSSEERIYALKNMGFDFNYQDYIDPGLGRVYLYCIVGIMFVSVMSVAALQTVLVARNAAFEFSLDRFVLWSLGGSISLSIAFFVALVLSTQKSFTSQIDTKIAVVLCFFVATLTSAIYFIIVQEINSGSKDNPIARVVLAMSFAIFSPFVYKALKHTSFNSSTKEIVKYSLFQGVALGMFMMIFQCLTSLAFSIDRFKFESLNLFYTENNYKMTFLSIIGFSKGFILAFFTSYVLQKSKRIEMLKSQREYPRAHGVIHVNLSFEQNKVSALLKDLSKTGAKVEFQCKTLPNDEVELYSKDVGDVQGVIKWIKKLRGGRVIAGICFSNEYSKIDTYLRKKHGAFYA